MTLLPGLVLFWIFASVACLAAVVLVGPAIVAVSWLSAHRAVGFLVRGSLERTCVAGCGFAAAVATVVQSLLVLEEGPGLSFALLAFAGPALIGVAPWVAGEILSGPSEEQGWSLLASLGASAGTLWTFAAFVLTLPRVGLAGYAAEAAVALVASGLSTAAYLRARGSEDAALVPA